MTKQTKTIAMVLGLGAIGYWVWSRNKAKKSLNPFAKSSSFAGGDDFFNATGSNQRPKMKIMVNEGNGALQMCTEGCKGECQYAVYGSDGKVASYRHTNC